SLTLSIFLGEDHDRAAAKAAAPRATALRSPISLQEVNIRGIDGSKDYLIAQAYWRCMASHAIIIIERAGRQALFNLNACRRLPSTFARCELLALSSD
ncbi:hypothetical protein, partial [Bradyrhizobium elkanii]|uniref:hypothetical protein n=1 Tax=Bradyrhizobium elkanii TaxID=29448 RepID=UPI001AED80BA